MNIYQATNSFPFKLFDKILISNLNFYSRYQFFLQLKHDLFSDRLEAPYDVAVQLSALSLQCEYSFRGIQCCHFYFIFNFGKDEERQGQILEPDINSEG